MTSESPTVGTKLCPTCGTRLSEDAKRCLVCGAEQGITAKPAKAVQGSRMPVISFSLPAAIGLLALFLTIGIVLSYFAFKTKPEVMIPVTPSATVTNTAIATVTPTNPPPTATFTPLPTPTPITYVVASNDTCSKIAGLYEVSVASIVSLNRLSADCVLTIGTTLLIPQPTPTATSPPTSTFSPAEMTEAACEKVSHVVAENDTLSAIAAAYGVTMGVIREENGLPGDTVFQGQKLVIPLCRRPTPPGPTATATLPPPYAAPALLLPADGAPFTLADDSVTLQWASVGNLRDNEAYAVTVEDITEGQGRKLVKYVRETKLIVPADFRPNDRTPHILRWTVTTVRQVGTNDEGDPIWEPAGGASVPRDFTWAGVAGATPTP